MIVLYNERNMDAITNFLESNGFAMVHDRESLDPVGKKIARWGHASRVLERSMDGIEIVVVIAANAHPASFVTIGTKIGRAHV